MCTVNSNLIICSKFTIKIPERRKCCSGVFVVIFEQISTHYSTVSIVDFKQVNAGWDTGITANIF